MAKEKYKACRGCDTLHLVHPNFRDKRPTCFKCGRDQFEMYSGNPSKQIQDQKNERPIYCDWNLQHQVDQTADNIASFLAKRYGKNVDLAPELLSDVKQYLIFAANSTRRSFAAAKDTYN